MMELVYSEKNLVRLSRYLLVADDVNAALGSICAATMEVVDVVGVGSVVDVLNTRCVAKMEAGHALKCGGDG